MITSKITKGIYITPIRLDFSSEPSVSIYMSKAVYSETPEVPPVFACSWATVNSKLKVTNPIGGRLRWLLNGLYSNKTSAFGVIAAFELFDSTSKILLLYVTYFARIKPEAR